MGNVFFLFFILGHIEAETQALNKNKAGSGLTAGFNDYNLLRLKTNLKPRYCEGTE